MTAPKGTCATCRYGVEFTPPRRKTSLWNCRISPPVVHPKSGDSVWPLVQPTYWCGKHSPRPPKPLAEHEVDCPCDQHIRAIYDRLQGSDEATILATWPKVGPRQRASLDRLTGKGFSGQMDAACARLKV